MTMRVAVLGTGIMGAGMASNLVRDGHDVVVWNRTGERAERLAQEVDVTVAATPRDAADDVDAVVTMVIDADAVREVMTGPHGALAVDGPRLWVQSSTVGEDIAGLSWLAREASWPIVDAPVLGTRTPAEEGTLTTLVAGDPGDLERARPLLGAWGDRTVQAGPDVGDASRLKLAVNAWIIGLLSGLAESLTVARRLGVDPSRVLSTIEDTAVDAPYAQAKGAAMVAGSFDPQFPLTGMAKDLGLIRSAAGEDLPGLAAIARTAAVAIEDGHGDDDMAALVTGLPST